MDWTDRLLWMAIGGALGYSLRLLQEIKKEVHEVDDKIDHLKSDESGFVRIPLVLDILLVILMGATFYSIFRVEASVDRSDKAIEDIRQNQAQDQAQNDRIDRVASCTLEYTAKTIRALNERTTYTAEQIRANVDVLESQLKFLRVALIRPPVEDRDLVDVLAAYTNYVNEYVKVADKNGEKTARFAYPTNKELAQCLGGVAELKEELDHD